MTLRTGLDFFLGLSIWELEETVKEVSNLIGKR